MLLAAVAARYDVCKKESQGVRERDIKCRTWSERRRDKQTEGAGDGTQTSKSKRDHMDLLKHWPVGAQN